MGVITLGSNGVQVVFGAKAQEIADAKRREEASAWNKAMSQFNGKGKP